MAMNEPFCVCPHCGELIGLRLQAMTTRPQSPIRKVARQLIADLLAETGYAMKPHDIVEKTGLPEGTVRVALRRMARDGQVVCRTYGNYEDIDRVIAALD